MLTYTQIRDHLADGLDATAIAAIYAKNMATVQDIDADLLQGMLAREGLLYENPLASPPTWEGSLVAAVKKSGNAGLLRGLVLLINQLKKPTRKVISTTDPEYGALLAGMLAAASLDPSINVAKLTGTLAALSGGRKHDGLTAESVAAIVKSGDRAATVARLQESATNAAALFRSRAEQADPAWTDQQARDEWAKVWGAE